jgi:hypothetical protein
MFVKAEDLQEELNLARVDRGKVHVGMRFLLMFKFGMGELKDKGLLPQDM